MLVSTPRHRTIRRVVELIRRFQNRRRIWPHRLAPKSDVSVEDPCANASILVFPRLTAPASVIRRTTVASYGGTKFLKTLLEAVVLIPLVQKLSLIDMGIPSKGRTSPLLNKRSAFWAC